MPTTHELLVQAKQKASLQSDYALANRLGVSRQLMSHWQNGRELPNTLGAIKLAELLGRDPIEVIAEIEIERAERANRPGVADEWRHILNKAATGFVGVFLAGSILIAPDPVNASSISPLKSENLTHSDSVYYVN